jgi:DNA polymerase III sliding clamp (beta) subunit (PCNA family)
MSNDASSLNREQFLRALNLVRPALAAQSYVPILTHFLLSGGKVTAYNDVQGIQVAFPTGMECAVPGELLVKMLGNLKADEVLVTILEGQVLVSSGRSRLKLSYLPIKDFPFSFPTTSPMAEIIINADFIKGVKKCLVSVGKDPTRPEQLGITLDSVPTLYSTDNHTISMYRLDSPKLGLPADAPVILPTFFCEQLVALSDAFPDLTISMSLYPGAVVGNVGLGANSPASARIFSKLVAETEPLDFDKIIRKHITEEDVIKFECEVPDTFDPAFDRALLILGTEVDKVTRVAIDGKKAFLLSTSGTNEVRDQVTLGIDLSEMEFLIDPELVSRGLKVSNRVSFMPKVMVMRDDSKRFTHLVAHCASVKG